MDTDRRQYIDLQIQNKAPNNEVWETLKDNEERIYYSIYGSNKMPKSAYDLSGYNWT